MADKQIYVLVMLVLPIVTHFSKFFLNFDFDNCNTKELFLNREEDEISRSSN